MSEKQKHLLITAAGTGGHVMPGLAVAREMKARGWTVSWVGTLTGMESKLIAKDNIPFEGLDFQGLRGKGVFGLFTGAIKLIMATQKAKSVIRAQKPDVVFTTGGYIAVPVCNAAKKCHVKVALMNADADILMSSKLILNTTSAVACGFAGSARSVAGDKGRITGNTVRAEIEALPAPQERLEGREGKLKLLVFGGSLGAQVFNETVPKALALFDEDKRPEVVHQCGVNSVEKVKAAYEALGIQATVVGFIDDMAAAYRDSDIVLCRSGAMSVSELCAAGAASILVPLVVKTTQHQLGNARYMATRGAAILMEQPQLTPEHLFGQLMSLKRDRILSMAKAARGLARKGAVESVCNMIEEVDQGNVRLMP